MKLHDPNFLSFGGEPITGRVPPALLVDGNRELTPQQKGGVAHAYKLFRDALKVSITPFLVQNRILEDGTTVRMVSNNGLDTVTVNPPPSGGDVEMSPVWVMVRTHKKTSHTTPDATAESHARLYRLPLSLKPKHAKLMYSGVTLFPFWSLSQTEVTAPGGNFSVGIVGAPRGFFPLGDKALMWSQTSPAAGLEDFTIAFGSATHVYHRTESNSGEVLAALPMPLAKKQADYIVRTLPFTPLATRFERFMLDGSGTVGTDPDGVPLVPVGTVRATPPYSRREIGTYSQGPTTVFEPNRGTPAKLYDRHYNNTFTFSSFPTRHPAFFVDGQFIEVAAGSAVSDMTFGITTAGGAQLTALDLRQLPGLMSDSFFTSVFSGAIAVEHGALYSGDITPTVRDLSFVYTQAPSTDGNYIQVTFVVDQSSVAWPA